MAADEAREKLDADLEMQRIRVCTYVLEHATVRERTAVSLGQEKTSLAVLAQGRKAFDLLWGSFSDDQV